ncbi:MAG: hypothetical protein ABW321_29335, partial [Polyangiales bacterium]
MSSQGRLWMAVLVCSACAPVSSAELDVSADSELQVLPLTAAETCWPGQSCDCESADAPDDPACARWLAPETLDNAQASDVSSPNVGVIGGGAAVVSWGQIDGPWDGAGFPGESIRSRRFILGTWEAERIVYTSAPGDDVSFAGPYMTTDRSGRALLAYWEGGLSWDTRLLSASRLVGGEWSAPVEVLSTSAYISFFPPRLYGSRRGQGLLVAGFGSGRDGSSHVSARFIGGVWQPPQRIPQVDMWPYWANSPEVALDRQGSAWAVWSQPLLPPVEGVPSPSRYRISASQLTASAETWSEPVIIEEAEGSSFRTRIALRDDGQRGIATWQAGDVGFRFSHFVAGSGWSDPAALPASLVVDQLAVDDRGDAVAIGLGSDEVRAGLFAAESGSWTDLGVIDGSAGREYSELSLALERSGSALAAWTRRDGVYRAAWVARYTPGSGWGTPRRLDPEANGDAYAPQVALDEQ